jgi:hypothetical protein
MWEYRCLVLDWQSDPTPALNEAAQKGWRLVTALPAVPAVGSDWSHRYLLERDRRRIKL